MGGMPIALKDFVNQAIKIYGRGKIQEVSFPADRQKIEIGDYIASWKKIRRAFRWQPKVSLDEGIRQSFDYYSLYKKHYWKFFFICPFTPVRKYMTSK